ncbi:MAG: PACE efflux transporter [Oxalicibacterium faecigallinarum]|uniref:PACE efflux transporter n=1 Tax=Oxalicibacterium faecigallinarum TaxID=573741 RepID=UPI002809DC98|nr:PACE efflux transporter [Oxalicibacterium faecigallinarum]MDQ7968112.1 PACE efflux transporter [Oxalicibacterium faecigallinarum]
MALLCCSYSGFVINTLLRRILHAVLFEVCALIILVPLMSIGFGMDMLHFGGLAVLLALCAMASNIIYNHFYEMVEHHYGWQRTVRMRVVHTLGFEAFFMAIALPLTAWWLSISVVEALLLDVTFSIFFMIYAFCFNWVFDIARHRLAARVVADR